MVAFDFETTLIRPGLQAPPPVCMSYADGDQPGKLYATAEVRDRFVAMLETARATGQPVWGHNVAYDCACAIEWLDCVDLIIDCYDRDLILDTMIFERIAEIGQFTRRKVLSLDVVGAAYGLHCSDKDSARMSWDEWQASYPNVPTRISYGPLYGLSLESYSDDQIRYAIEDAETTERLQQRQQKRYGDRVRLADIAFMTRKALWLQLTRNRGLRTDPNRLEQLRIETEAFCDELRGFAQWAGLVRADGTRDMRAIRAMVTDAYEGSPPMTEPQRGRTSKKEFVPQVSTARAVLEESGHPILETFAEFGENSAVLNKDLPMLELGTVWPIHTKFGIADTTRSTSAKPNVQNPRRKEGIRECFIPREGYCFLSADHGGLENCTLAQVIVWNLGLHDMADAINRGDDLHCRVAVPMLGRSYEDILAGYLASDAAIANARNCCKVVNFGRPGGMGKETLKFYAKQAYGLDFTDEFSGQMIQFWNQANPNGMRYLQWIKTLPKDGDRYTVTIPGTTIIRRGATFCAAANTHFQGLGAVVEAHVGWCLVKERFRTGSPLAQCPQVNFIHDENQFECPLGDQDLLHSAGERLSEIMSVEARKYLPDVQIKADAVAASCWSKRAKRVLDAKGRLAVWSPK